MINPILEKVKRFSIEKFCLADIEITENSNLQNDLDISGDDTIEFIIAFGKEFDVGISKFKINDYFETEHEATYFLFRKILRIKNKKIFKPLTIGDLVKAINKKRLV